MRMPEHRELGPEHLKKAASLVGFNLKKPTIRDRVTDEEVVAWVDQTMLETREFADDVETVGLQDVDEDDYVGGDWQMTMIGVANRPWEALVLSPGQTKLLQPVFTDPLIWRYEHNGEYDNYFIERYINPADMVNQKFDTMQAAHRLRSHLPKKLKPSILSRYTWLPYYNRDLGKLDERLYNGMDLVTTFQAAKEQRRQLEKWGLTEIFHHFDMPLLPIMEEWRRVGVKVDVRRALLFRRLTEMKIERAEALISKLCGPMFNPRSRLDTFAYFYAKWQLPVQTKKDPANRQAPPKTTLDYEARKRLRFYIEADPTRTEHFKAPLMLLNLMDFIAGEKKKLEYLNRISPDGRIHPYYKGHGASSFRLASVPNLQNFPVYDISAWGGARRDDNATADNPIEEQIDKEEERAVAAAEGKPKQGSLRSLVISDSGDCWLMTYDIEQIQIWALAAQFKVKYLLEVFESGEYLYGSIYEKLYKEPYFEEGRPRTKKYRLPDISEQRIRRTKAVPLGFLFNRTAKAVAEEYGWSLEEGKQLKDWWFSLCSELKVEYPKAEYFVTQNGYYRHAYGHIVFFPKKASDVFNSCAQTTEAMYMRESIIMIDQEIKRRIRLGEFNPASRTALSVHDSLTANIHQDDVLAFHYEVATPILGRAVPQLGGFRFRFSAEISKQWDWSPIGISEWEKQHIGAVKIYS